MNKLWTIVSYGLLALFAATAAALAPGTDGDFDLSWHVIGGGGGTSSGPTFDLTGTTGQHHAGDPMTGGTFSFVGGFWAAPETTGAPCPPDINGDGVVDFADLLEVLGAWGESGGPADVNGDGTVDFGDLLEVLGGWGACP